MEVTSVASLWRSIHLSGLLMEVNSPQWPPYGGQFTSVASLWRQCATSCNYRDCHHYSLHTCAAPTGAPANLTAIQSTTQSLTLSWDLPRFDQQNGIIRYYIVTINDIANDTSWEVNVNATRTTIPGLQPFTTYNSTVAAFTVGRGPDSAPIMTTLPQGGQSVL